MTPFVQYFDDFILHPSRFQNRIDDEYVVHAPIFAVVKDRSGLFVFIFEEVVVGEQVLQMQK